MKCPNCEKTIEEGATQCDYCDQPLPQKGQAYMEVRVERDRENDKPFIVLLILLFCVIMVLVSMLGSHSTTKGKEVISTASDVVEEKFEKIKEHWR